VEVADREQGTRHVDRQPQLAARDELTNVHVAAGLAWRDRSETRSGLAWQRKVRRRVGDGLAGRHQLVFASLERLHSLRRGRYADHTCERVSGHGHAGQLFGTSDSVRDLPLHDVGIGEQVGEHAEARDDRGDSEVGRLVGDELHLEDPARLGALDKDRAGQRMAETELDSQYVLV
jgi:hypothetical protein